MGLILSAVWAKARRHGSFLYGKYPLIRIPQHIIHFGQRSYTKKMIIGYQETSCSRIMLSRQVIRVLANASISSSFTTQSIAGVYNTDYTLDKTKCWVHDRC